ncbi:hypothetical protein GCM10023081_34740 [Arthrobacter ginkgonis]|uniref:YCII-related domain-containing protein n=1 Tax=Arthrobacter ginkgonis TaxID=1630594 RepID=A0ABP7CUT9_9MICC
MTVFAVEYVYAPESEAGRDEHRPGHRAFLTSLKESGNVSLITSGPYVDGSGALLIFAAPSEEDLTAALARDPFNAEGFVAALRITGWIPASGELSHYAAQ